MLGLGTIVAGQRGSVDPKKHFKGFSVVVSGGKYPSVGLYVVTGLDEILLPNLVEITGLKVLINVSVLGLMVTEDEHRRSVEPG